MRRILSTTLYLCIYGIFGAACSDPKCGGHELKVADTCYPLDDTQDPATAADGGDSGANGERASERKTPGKDAGSRRVDASEPAAGDTDPNDGMRDAGVDARLATEPTPIVRADQETDAGAKLEADAAATELKADANAPLPVVPPASGPSCTPSAEICDGRDNDCDGLTDENPALWYCDADGDGYAASTTGKVESCNKPAPTGSCKDWTARAPSSQSEQDCDDSSALRFPDANFGVAPSSSGDLNCDGKVEAKIEFVAAWRDLTVSSTTTFNICTERGAAGQCDCWASTVIAKNFSGFDANGRGIQDSSVPYFEPNFPCAEALTDVIHLQHGVTGPDAMCQYSQRAVVRQLCR